MKAAAPRLSSIEAMRGIASIAVALFHLSSQFSSDIPRFFQQYGWLGVDVFFVISGFVIPLSLNAQGYRLRHFPRFALRRLVRLEPPYLASIALGIVLWHLSTVMPGFKGVAPSYSIPQIASHLFYAVPLFGYEWLSPVYWTLAYEFVFYAVVGLSFSFLIVRRVEWTVLIAVAAVLAKFLVSSKIDLQLLEFACGVLVMRLVVDQSAHTAAASWIILACIVIGWVSGPRIGVAVFAASSAIYLFRSADLGKWSYALGGISYSLYLTHVPIGGRIINLGTRFGTSVAFEIGLLVLALGVSLLSAVIFSRLIEAPAIRASRTIAVVPQQERRH